MHDLSRLISAQKINPGHRGCERDEEEEEEEEEEEADVSWSINRSG